MLERILALLCRARHRSKYWKFFHAASIEHGTIMEVVYRCKKCQRSRIVRW